jgi:hypothetical protein
MRLLGSCQQCWEDDLSEPFKDGLPQQDSLGWANETSQEQGRAAGCHSQDVRCLVQDLEGHLRAEADAPAHLVQDRPRPGCGGLGVLCQEGQLGGRREVDDGHGGGH